MTTSGSFAWSPATFGKWRRAFGELLEAHYFAVDLRRPAADFAIPVSRLAQTGLTPNDLRWLAAKGFIERPGTGSICGVRAANGACPPRARAKPPSPHGNRVILPTRGRFILTAAGHAFASHVCKLSPSGLMGEGRAEGAHSPFPLKARSEFSRTEEGDVAAHAAYTTRPSSPFRGKGRGEGIAGTCPICGTKTGTSIETVPPIPRWDGATRTLWLGSVLVKQFKVPARNQELILSVFAEDGWPESIDDPLPPTTDTDPKLRLRDAISRLNRNQKQRLLRFHGNGNGRAVHWELAARRARSSTD